MKAIAYTKNGLPIESAESLVDIEVPTPVPGPRDLLVEVRAVSVNPVDTKIRRNVAVTEPRVLGHDASGIVSAVGSEVTLFQPGDAVFYAGSIQRPGSNSELQLVDERIVGKKPASLGFGEAAALPLTSLTAWELLFDRLGVLENGAEENRLLIIGAGGGVGSILTQLARKLTCLTVIGTTSRPETRQWVMDLGAHHVIDHTQTLATELVRVGMTDVTHVASLTHTDSYYSQLVGLLAPQGRLGVIDEPRKIDVLALKEKSLSLHWESMFTRSSFQTVDMVRQHEILNRVSDLIDQRVLKTTLGEHFGAINAANLRRAHALVESGKARGKIVLEGF